MRILRLGPAAAVVATASLLACLTTPEEPDSTNQPLNCTANERAFNGACREVCTTTANCPLGQTCMVVGGDRPLCLDYKHCAYLGSDTKCGPATSGVAGGPYDPYWHAYGYGDGYTHGTGYGYAGNGCVGDATWQTLAESGEPACGQQHAVTRCRATPSGCALVSGATMDVADP